MDNNLKLITTEKFGELDCSFYRNMNDDILLTREQIGQALEYKDPSKAIQKNPFETSRSFGIIMLEGEGFYFRPPPNLEVVEII